MLTFFLSQKASYLDTYHEKSPWPAWLRFPSHQCCENRWFSLSLWSKTATIGNMLCELATEAEICYVMTKKKAEGYYTHAAASQWPPLLTQRAERPLAPGPAPPRARGAQRSRETVSTATLPSSSPAPSPRLPGCSAPRGVPAGGGAGGRWGAIFKLLEPVAAVGGWEGWAVRGSTTQRWGEAGSGLLGASPRWEALRPRSLLP